MQNHKISLVIPAYNEEKSLGPCLETALKAGAGRFHEIIVINNASTDGTRAVALRYPGVRVVDEPRKGLTRARECGLKEATGDILAYIDADTQMPLGWYDKLEAAYRKHPGMACYSGPYRYHDGKKWKNMVMTGLWYVSAPLTYRIAGYMVLGGNFAARRDALVAMGGFDDNIEFYGEDTDIARRISRFGKARFDMSFYIYTSSRRFQQEGLLKSNFTYAMNFLWPALFGRPFTKKHHDIRI